jgi:hypothetical protein
MSAELVITEREVTVRFHSRAHLHPGVGSLQIHPRAVVGWTSTALGF